MTRCFNIITRRFLLETLVTILLLVMMLSPALSQTPFNSGSTGADGAFNPQQNQTIQVPESGVLNFTTVTIPNGVAIFFKPNSKNTPVTILATGDVRIAGYFNVNGESGNRTFGGFGGPGGFRGGDGGVWLNDPAGKPGDGPGGGIGGTVVSNGTDSNGGGGGGYSTDGGSGSDGGSTIAPGGKPYGSKTLLPLIGGSGGGGASAPRNGAGGGGGGGGGAILLASSTKIIFESGWDAMGIYAIGGAAGCSNTICGGGGSGGAIRLIANTITGAPRLWAYGGDRGYRGNIGGLGFVRCEAFDLTQLRQDTRGNDDFSSGRPNPIVLANNPQLRILSVGGVNAPALPTGSFYSAQPDITIAETVPNPLSVVVQGSNLPVNSSVLVTRIADTNDRVTDSCALSGTQTSSTCTARVSLPLSRISVITAAVTVDGLLAFNRPIFIEGERVLKMEVAAAFGASSQVTYITETGRRIKLTD